MDRLEYCDSFFFSFLFVLPEKTKPFICSGKTPTRSFVELLDNSPTTINVDGKPRKFGKKLTLWAVGVVRSDTRCRGVTSDILASDSLNNISPQRDNVVAR